jgi:transposase InsO family protein
VPDIKAMIERKDPFWAHAFDVACARNDIDHRLTKHKHLWTNGQVERTNRTIKEATVKRFHYYTHDELRSHLSDFVSAYNFAKRLKALKVSRPTNTSARSGQKSPNDSRSIRSSKCRD